MTDLLEEWRDLERLAGDEARSEARAKRHAKGYRTARENLADLVDDGSFLEYGRAAVAAQRERRTIEELRRDTAADGVITGLATINADAFGVEAARAAVVVNDYSVLAGTQGYFHHRKIDRLLDVARARRLPVVMYAEGGGGRPGDVDVKVVNAGLTVPTFATWAGLSGVVPRVAIANGYCFAGNAALLGCADVTVATRRSWIGMAGPAMIEGGGLGTYRPDQIGPAERLFDNGVIDVLVEDEAEATAVAKQLLGYFQGDLATWTAADPAPLRDALPADRRYSYHARPIVERVVDEGSFLELRRPYGGSVITGLARIEGRPIGVLANDTKVLGGALDATASDKAARFLQLLDAFCLPLVSLCDTPGFMVGPASEEQAAVRRMSRLFVAGASFRPPFVCVFLRKGYGLGAMAMAGGSLQRPDVTVAWPQGEFGAMGLEGAVRLGFARELEAAESDAAREALFDRLVRELYDAGKAAEAAAFLELDAVIDPAETRAVIAAALSRVGREPPRAAGRLVDTW
ncbi:MAG: biotin carboxylase [Sandaracinaceae bacterium]|nr:biotin carboxylase [Sandaracinaceae bacterium]